MKEAIKKREGVLGNDRVNRYERAIFVSFGENNATVYQSEQGVVFANPHIATGMMTGTALADDDIAAVGQLSTKNLDAQAFTFRFAAVFGGSYTFLMCHGWGELYALERK
ncbi:MAG: hypothetical protein RLZZ617_949 [Bacteroidota bacterium]